MKVVKSTNEAMPQPEIEIEQENPKTLTEILTEAYEANKDRFRYGIVVYSDTAIYLLNKLKAEKDYIDGNMHFIPRSVNPDRVKDIGYKYAVWVYCADNKDIKRRAEKILTSHVNRTVKMDDLWKR